MEKLKTLSVFFPAYNEEGNISRTIEAAYRIIPEFAHEFEIIVINDGSRDNTAGVLLELSKKYSALRIVTHTKNRGYGGALQSGFKHARYEHIFLTDGDGQFDMADLKYFIPLSRDCDIVAGFRIKRQDPFYRIVNAKAYNFLVRILFGLALRDIDCAFKLIRRNVVDSLVLKSETQFISAEFLIKAKKKGFVIKQAGALHYPREKGKATGNNVWVIITTFGELFKLWNELKSQAS